MSQLELQLVEPEPERRSRALPPGWSRVRKGGVKAERVILRDDGSALILDVEPDVHAWTHIEHAWQVGLRNREGRLLGSWYGTYTGGVIDGAEAAEVALLELLPLLDRIAAAGERCGACLLVEPHPFHPRSTPCPWCGTASKAGTLWWVEKARLEAAGWVPSGCGLVPGEAAA